MKIPAVENIHYFLGNNITANAAFKNFNSKLQAHAEDQYIPSSKITPSNKFWGYMGAGLVSAGIIAGIIYKLYKRKSLSSNPTNIMKNVYNAIVSEFPEDRNYYSSIASAIGLKQGEEFKLSSLVGVSQLKKLLKTFTPKDFRLGQNYEGIENYTFRVSLHNHTQASDGLLSARDILEQAAKWADRIAQKTKPDGKPPFTIAITDHDTLSGLKDVAKILSENPERYKNLRVVLGSEISVSNINPQHVIRPVDFELIGYSLNPFNVKLNTLLENLQASRKQAILSLLQKINQQYPGYNLNFAEAEYFHLNLKNIRTNGVLNLAGDYAEFKIRLSDYVDKINKIIIPQNSDKLDTAELFKILGKNYYFNLDATNENDMCKFLRDKGLKKILEEKGLLNDKNIGLYNSIFENDYSDVSSTIKKFVREGLPTIQDTKKYCLLPEEVFATIDSPQDGFFGVAHPALINLKSPTGDNISAGRKVKLGNQDPNKNLVFEIFNDLKQKGKELFCATEVNYQSYKPSMSTQWIDFMKKDIADNPLLNLLYTGGTDTHSPSIFSNHSYLPAEIVKKYELQDILGAQHETFANILKALQLQK